MSVPYFIRRKALEDFTSKNGHSQQIERIIIIFSNKKRKKENENNKNAVA